MSAQAAPNELVVVRGPSALGGELRRFVHLTWLLATTEFKLRFFGSALGYLWQLARPLMLFGVLYAVFTQIVKFGSTGVPHYPVHLLIGVVLFTAFAESTAGSVQAVVVRENLVRKIQFPRMVIPLAVVLTAGFNLALNLVVVFVFVLASGIGPQWSWLELPLILIPLIVFATGVAMLLSALYVRYRDIGPIWDVVLQMLFYGTPIFYAVQTIPVHLRQVVMSNPLAGVIEQMRHAVIGGSGAPTALDAVGSVPRLLVPIAIVIVVFALGFWVFNREAPRVAEDL
jgi:ABC-2 type transport system permease protein